MDLITVAYALVTLVFATLLYQLLWTGRPTTAPKSAKPGVIAKEKTDSMYDDYKPDDVTVATTEQVLPRPQHSLELREDPDVLAALAAAEAAEVAAVKTEQIIKQDEEQGSQEPDAEQLGWSFVLPEK